MALLRLPRQSVGGGEFIRKRLRKRSPLLKPTTLEGNLTFGDPFLDSCVVGPGDPEAFLDDTMQGYLAYKKPPPPLDPYSRTMPRVL